MRNQQNQDFAHLITTAFANAPAPQVTVNAPANGNGNDNRSGPRPADIGYFCPRKHTGSGVWSDGKITKYFDVFHFIERLKHIERVYSADDVRRVWSQCLLDDALEWHSHVLTENDRQLLETATVDAICGKLKARFAKSFSDAMASLKAERLTLYDVSQGRDVTSFLQTVISNAKSCEMGLSAQLIAAFEALAPEMKSELTKPSTNTTLESFLDDVRSRESVIIDLAKQRYPTNVARPRQITPAYSGRSTVPYNSQYQSTQPQRWQPRFQAQQFLPGTQLNRPYPTNQPQNQNQNQFQIPMRPGGRGQIWSAGYSRPWMPPDQYAAWRRQQDEVRQTTPQQSQQAAPRPTTLVPENRRLPAPPAPYNAAPPAPYNADHNRRGQPQPAYHGESVDSAEQPDTSAYQPPSVEEVPDEDLGLDTAAQVFDFPLDETFQPFDGYNDRFPEDNAFFGTTTACPSICRYCTKHFPSNNALMDHVHSTHLTKPRPRNRKDSAFTANTASTSLKDSQRRSSCLDGASKNAPEESVANSKAKN
ncbi:hypothetical protein diail_3097 [Diaporthe ilicicola]|nr:hypothetical protein diail_3097 [Diaporthe ilicicola]